ncbi:MAG: ABC transporter ATP-binding protein [Solirubrobacteraceae bacterium]
MATPAVRASGLVKRFDSTIAVDDVDIEVAPGEVRGLLGPNGAGKTTLLRMLFGLVAPDAGSVALCGRPLRLNDPLALDGVAGFVEDPSFYPYLTGRANLQLFAELDGQDARQRVDDALARVDLLARAGDRVSVYSSGMRQRLGIAAALLRNPRLLMLDEPTSGLDPAGARDVGALLRELSSHGVAVLLSSHLIGEIENICDCYTVLDRGRVVWSGSAAQLRAQAPVSAYVLVTSDDERALEIAELHPGRHARRTPTGELEIELREPELDAYVLALGRDGVAVRRLDLRVSPLQSMFFALTDDAARQTAQHRQPTDARRRIV